MLKQRVFITRHVTKCHMTSFVISTQRLQDYYTIHGTWCHVMHKKPISRRLLSYTIDQQFDHQCHLMTTGVQVHSHEYVHQCYEVYIFFLLTQHLPLMCSITSSPYKLKRKTTISNISMLLC